MCVLVAEIEPAPSCMDSLFLTLVVTKLILVNIFKKPSFPVIVGHSHIDRSSLQEVLGHSVPYKFRVHARVLAYHPPCTTVSGFLHLYCQRCLYLWVHCYYTSGL